jgi:phosphoglycerate dehydrogenase-like enzyme
MAGEAFFGAMKRPAYFINTSRGRLVNEAALYQALTAGVIAGAGLDVHSMEPRPAGDRLAALENVLLTPHYAGGAKSGLLAELETIIRNCQAALKGGSIVHEVTADGAGAVLLVR